VPVFIYCVQLCITPQVGRLGRGEDSREEEETTMKWMLRFVLFIFRHRFRNQWSRQTSRQMNAAGQKLGLVSVHRLGREVRM